MNKNWKKKVAHSCLLAGIGSLCLYTQGFAETQSVEEEETREIVVSATRTEMEVKDTPTAVTVINRQQIEDRKADNLIDALRDVAGVYVKPTSSMSMDNPIRIRGSEGNHVLILIDGKRINGEASAVNARELERIRLDNVERIEILKGPASSLYGNEALGGVINVITRKPTKAQLELYADYKVLEGQGDASNNLGFYFQSDKKGSFAWALGAGVKHTNALSLEPGVTEYLYGDTIPINFKGVWDIHKDQTLTLDLGYLKEDFKNKSRLNIKNRPPSYDNVTYDNERFDYSLDWSGKKDTLDWQLRFYGSRYEKEYNSYNQQTGAFKSKDEATNKLNVLEGRLSKAIGEKHLVTGGFETSHQSLDGTRILDGGQSQNKYAFYLQDEWMPSEKWLIIPSVRVEKVDSFTTSATPKIGATYFVKPDMRIKMNLATGYRTPSLAERYNHWIMANVSGMPIHQYGNPDLKEEKSVMGEIGFEKDWKKHSAQVRFYRNNVKDLINSKMYTVMLPIIPPRPSHLIATYENVEDAVLQGFELSSSHKLSKELDLRLGYNYLDAYDNDSDERLSGRSRHQFTLGFNFKPLNSPWSFALDGNYLADYLYDDGTNNPKNKSFLIANGTISRKVGKDQKGTVYVGVENIFDKKDYDMYYYGRTYVMGMSYKF